MAALVAGCTREDNITPDTPSQHEKTHIKRIYMEQNMVFEILNTTTNTWDTSGELHSGKYLAMEWFWNGDRLDSIIESAFGGTPYTYRFTYDNDGLLTRYDQYQDGIPTDGYLLFYYDADKHLSKYEEYGDGELYTTATIDSYVGDKISHMKYKNDAYDIDINYIHDGDNVSEMVVDGLIDNSRLHVVYSYVHDQYPNPYGFNLFNIITPREPYRFLSANNVLVEFARTTEGDMDDRDTRTEYVYRYENNLPVEMSYVSITGNYISRMTTTTTEYYEY